MRLQGKLMEDAEWTDIPDSAHPQHDLSFILRKMKAHGFTVEETDTVFRVINPITNQKEAEYRII